MQRSGAIREPWRVMPPRKPAPRPKKPTATPSPMSQPPTPPVDPALTKGAPYEGMPYGDSDDGFLLALHAYWEQKRAGRSLPDRADIDPVEMPPRLLPYLFIVEYANIPARWRYRLMGTEMVERLGADLTGRYLDEALGGRYCNYL